MRGNPVVEETHPEQYGTVFRRILTYRRRSVLSNVSRSILSSVGGSSFPPERQRGIHHSGLDVACLWITSRNFRYPSLSRNAEGHLPIRAGTRFQFHQAVCNCEQTRIVRGRRLTPTWETKATCFDLIPQMAQPRTAAPFCLGSSIFYSALHQTIRRSRAIMSRRRKVADLCFGYGKQHYIQD